MRSLRELLTTWENWSTREVNRQALARAGTERQRAVMRDALERGEDIDALEVLRDTSELVALLTGWRWQIVAAARERGATWAEIGTAVGVSAKQAESDHCEALARQDDRKPGAAWPPT